MNCQIEPKDVQAMESCNILQQTSYWANVKDQQGIDPYAFDYIITDDLINPHAEGNKRINDDILVLVRHIDNNFCYAYIPYGPKDEPSFENHGLFMEELAEVLRPALPSNCFMIRFDLPWENQWAVEKEYFDSKGNWKGPPPMNSQEFRINFNTRTWNLHKSHTDVLPVNTIFQDLKQDEETLLRKMKPKTRYNIRLALRKGIRIREYGPDKLDEWYHLYKETAARNNIILHGKKYFEKVMAADINNDPSVRRSLLMADHEGDYLAAMFLVLSKKRGTYLYGASSGRKRNLMATYALQWEAIRLAKEAGCSEYDMFGSAPNSYSNHPMHGLYRFKSGFGGHLFHRMGCWDYPLKENEYKAFRAKEINVAFHLG